jgi:hypothetical protein
VTSKVIPFAVINLSTVLTPEQVKPYIVAQQIQITRDFFPYYGMDVRMLYKTSVKSIPLGAYTLLLMDDTDQENALGYHFDTPTTFPVAKVFVKTDIAHNLAWTVTASHEVIETLGDAWCNTVILTTGPQGRGIRLWAKELCDMVESDSQAYQINGVPMSNFVYPSWFEPDGPSPFDYMHKCNMPFQITPGGYMSVLDIIPGVQPQWREVFGQTMGRSTMRHPRTATSPRREKRYQSVSVSALQNMMVESI